MSSILFARYQSPLRHSRGLLTRSSQIRLTDGPYANRRIFPFSCFQTIPLHAFQQPGLSHPTVMVLGEALISPDASVLSESKAVYIRHSPNESPNEKYEIFLGLLVSISPTLLTRFVVLTASNRRRKFSGRWRPRTYTDCSYHFSTPKKKTLLTCWSNTR